MPGAKRSCSCAGRVMRALFVLSATVGLLAGPARALSPVPPNAQFSQPLGISRIQGSWYPASPSDAYMVTAASSSYGASMSRNAGAQSQLTIYSAPWAGSFNRTMTHDFPGLDDLDVALDYENGIYVSSYTGNGSLFYTYWQSSSSPISVTAYDFGIKPTSIFVDAYSQILYMLGTAEVVLIETLGSAFNVFARIPLAPYSLDYTPRRKGQVAIVIDNLVFISAGSGLPALRINGLEFGNYAVHGLTNIVGTNLVDYFMDTTQRTMLIFSVELPSSSGALLYFVDSDDSNVIVTTYTDARLVDSYVSGMVLVDSPSSIGKFLYLTINSPYGSFLSVLDLTDYPTTITLALDGYGPLLDSLVPTSTTPAPQPTPVYQCAAPAVYSAFTTNTLNGALQTSALTSTLAGAFSSVATSVATNLATSMTAGTALATSMATSTTTTASGVAVSGGTTTAPYRQASKTCIMVLASPTPRASSPVLPPLVTYNLIYFPPGFYAVDPVRNQVVSYPANIAEPFAQFGDFSISAYTDRSYSSRPSKGANSYYKRFSSATLNFKKPTALAAGKYVTLSPDTLALNVIPARYSNASWFYLEIYNVEGGYLFYASNVTSMAFEPVTFSPGGGWIYYSASTLAANQLRFVKDISPTSTITYYLWSRWGAFISDVLHIPLEVPVDPQFSTITPPSATLGAVVSPTGQAVNDLSLGTASSTSGKIDPLFILWGASAGLAVVFITAMASAGYLAYIRAKLEPSNASYSKVENGSGGSPAGNRSTTTGGAGQSAAWPNSGPGSPPAGGNSAGLVGSSSNLFASGAGTSATYASQSSFQTAKTNAAASSAGSYSTAPHIASQTSYTALQRRPNEAPAMMQTTTPSIPPVPPIPTNLRKTMDGIGPPRAVEKSTTYRNTLMSFTYNSKSTANDTHEKTTTLNTTTNMITFPAFLAINYATQLRNIRPLGAGGFATISAGELVRTEEETRAGNASVAKAGNASATRAGNGSAPKGPLVVTRVAIKGNPDFDMESSAFKTEVSLTYALQFCPHVVRLLGYTENPSFIVLKLYEGTLEEVCVKTALRPPLAEIIGFCLDISRAMEALHQYTIYHGDLKPLNCLYETLTRPNGTTYRHVAVTDFGLARMLDGSRADKIHGQKLKVVHGLSWRFASPELIQFIAATDASPPVHDPNSAIYLKSDVYAFAMIVFTLVSGDYAWPEASARKIQQHVLAGVRPSLAAAADLYRTTGGGAVGSAPAWLGLIDVMERCWVQDPVDRLTAKQVLDEMALLPAI